MANYKRQVIIYDLIIDGNVVFTGTVNEIAEKLGISSVALTNGNNNNYIRVKETPEQIIQLIKQAEEL